MTPARTWAALSVAALLFVWTGGVLSACDSDWEPGGGGPGDDDAGDDDTAMPDDDTTMPDDDAADDDTAMPDDDVADDDTTAPDPLDCSGPTVNGNPVSEPACSWLEHTGREVVPLLAGSRDQRLDIASIVAWWSLKEGVYFLDNPIVYSNCAFETGSEYIDPLETCPSGRAWQVGLSGIQVPTFLDEQPSQQAAALFPHLTEDQVLEQTATEALLTTSEIAAVVASTEPLRTSWLLRNCAIGFTLQVGIVEYECIDNDYSWCFGSGWTSTALYAPDKDAAMGSIADIRAIFDDLAP